MLIVSLADFTKNASTYLENLERGEITIEKDGKPYAKLIPDNTQRKLDAIKALSGVLPSNIDFSAERDERLRRI